jgi:hypothetical protein
MSFVVEGWSRDKDENLTCHVGYQKRQEMRQESQGDMGAKADFAQADHFSNQHP